MKFKVGETVYIKPRLMEGYVTSIDAYSASPYPYTVLCEGQNLYYSENELELLEEEKEMTHEYEEGKWYMWGGGECPLHPKDLAIVSALNPVNGNRVDSSNVSALPEEWEQKEHTIRIFAFKITKKYVPPVSKEMTIEEISKALGYDVKIVKG